MTFNGVWFSLGIGLGVVVTCFYFLFLNRRKSRLWEMKQLIKEASKDIHSGYEKIQALYQVVEIADRKGRVEK